MRIDIRKYLDKYPNSCHFQFGEELLFYYRDNCEHKEELIKGYDAPQDYRNLEI